MQLVDDRTEDQKRTHNWLVVMTDRFMSGWGKAEGGASYAAWACEHKHLDRVERWVRNRRDAIRVRVCIDNGGDLRYRPSGVGHCHIYCVGKGHASLRGVDHES